MYRHTSSILIYLTQMMLNVVDIQGGRQCRSSLAGWCGGCSEAPPPFKPTCTLRGRFPHPSNCSLFIECTGSGSASRACVCSCANRTMFFSSRLGMCRAVPPAAADAVSMSNSREATLTSRDCTILETHLSLFDGGLPRSNVTPARSVGAEPTQTLAVEVGTLPLRTTTTTTTTANSRKPLCTATDDTKRPSPPSTTTVDDSRGSRRLPEGGPTVIHDNPAVPTWIVALLVFLGVLVLLAVVLSLYH